MGKKDNVQRSAGGVGFFGFLALLFIGLKLGGAITWPWWLVLAPLWGPWALVASIFLGFVLFVGVISLVVAIAEHVEKRGK